VQGAERCGLYKPCGYVQYFLPVVDKCLYLSKPSDCKWAPTVTVFVVGINTADFVSQSTATNIVSYPSTMGNPMMKSIVQSTVRFSGIGRGSSSPRLCRPLHARNKGPLISSKAFSLHRLLKLNGNPGSARQSSLYSASGVARMVCTYGVLAQRVRNVEASSEYWISNTDATSMLTYRACLRVKSCLRLEETQGFVIGAYHKLLSFQIR